MESYSIGRVFSRAFDQVKSNFWTLLGFIVLSYFLSMFVMIFAAIPLFASIGINAASMAGGAAAHNPSAMLALFTSPSIWMSLGVLIVVALFVYSIMYAGSFYCLGAECIGEKASLGSCFSVGLKKAIPLFLTQLLLGLGVLIGYLFLIIPGVILALMWSVAAPACVLENIGATASLGRSNTLTKGSKGMIFLTYLVVGFAFLLVEILIFAIFGLSMGAMITPGMHPNPGNLGGALAGGMLMQLVFMLFGIFAIMAMLSLHVSVYRETRLINDGSDTGVADVFR